MFKIENDVPVPPQTRTGRPCKYPFSDMKPGQSVYITGEVEFERARNMAMARNSKTGKRRFISRRDGRGGGRIWCIA